jgi:hypothetical protein
MSEIGSIFGLGKKTAPVVQAGPPPVVEDTQAKAQQEQDLIRKRKGRASAILAGDDKKTGTLG